MKDTKKLWIVVVILSVITLVQSITLIQHSLIASVQAMKNTDTTLSYYADTKLKQQLYADLLACSLGGNDCLSALRAKAEPFDSLPKELLKQSASNNFELNAGSVVMRYQLPISAMLDLQPVFAALGFEKMAVHSSGEDWLSLATDNNNLVALANFKGGQPKNCPKGLSYWQEVGLSLVGLALPIAYDYVSSSRIAQNLCESIDEYGFEVYFIKS